MYLKLTMQWISLLIALSITVISCKSEGPKPNNNESVTFMSGVYIVNEGPFNSGTGSVSFYNKITGAVTNDIFQSANNVPLGNIVQSMTIHNGIGYVVVNNSGKIEVVNPEDFKSIKSIRGLSQPRYFLGIDRSKGYVTEWGSTGKIGAVKVIDLITNAVSSTITTGSGAESLVKVNDFVYVACSGGFANDSVVAVINTRTDAFTKNITVGPNPGSMQVDANGKLWVLCSGQMNASFTAQAKPGKLVRIDPGTNTVEQSYTFPSAFLSPSKLTINARKTNLYYTCSGKVYNHDISATAISTTIFINRSFYGLGVDPGNDFIYGADAGNYTSNGYVIRFDASGVKIDSFQVGVIPSKFYFE